MPGNTPCEIGCICKKHTNSGNRNGVFCKPNCTCHRHNQTHNLTEEGRKRLVNSLLGNNHGKGNKGRTGAIITAETRQKISKNLVGKKKTAEHIRNMSLGKQAAMTDKLKEKQRIARVDHMIKNPNCQCGMCRLPINKTRPERILELLLSEFPEIRPQEKFPPYKIDVYIPAPYHLAFEADGEFWHKPKRDQARDNFLLKKYNLPVIRLTSTELIAMGID